MKQPGKMTGKAKSQASRRQKYLCFMKGYCISYRASSFLWGGYVGGGAGGEGHELIIAIIDGINLICADSEDI